MAKKFIETNATESQINAARIATFSAGGGNTVPQGTKCLWADGQGKKLSAANVTKGEYLGFTAFHIEGGQEAERATPVIFVTNMVGNKIFLRSCIKRRRNAVNNEVYQYTGTLNTFLTKQSGKTLDEVFKALIKYVNDNKFVGVQAKSVNMPIMARNGDIVDIEFNEWDFIK